MVYALSDFVSIPSVSGSEPHREYCRQAAIWLQASLAQLGAEAYWVRANRLWAIARPF
jgi:di- and tripeptidase